MKKIATGNRLVRKIIELANGNLLVVSLPSNIHLVTPSGETINILQQSNIQRPNTIAINQQQTFFAIGSLNGDVVLCKNTNDPQVFHTTKVHGEIQKISFSPQGENFAVFVGNHIYIYDVKIPTKKFEMYNGYYKVKGVTFSEDWSKAYIADALGEVMLFDQSYIFDKQKLYEKILNCEKVVPEKNGKSLIFYINSIENKITK